MNNKQNKIYQNSNIRNLNNTKLVYSTLDRDNKNNKNNETNYIKKDTTSNIEHSWLIKQKISNIFNSNNFIYKADVTIVTDKEKLSKRIVGKNKDYLFTIDNEYIKISDIKDIYQ